jgi:hypothetical protein
LQGFFHEILVGENVFHDVKIQFQIVHLYYVRKFTSTH